MELSELVRVVLSHTALSECPRMVMVPKLEHLDLSHNQLKDVTGLEEGLPALQHLDLSHNKPLTSVTAVALRLVAKRLQSLKLDGNVNLSMPTQEIIERGDKEVRQYFLDLSRGQKTCWSQTVMVVGQGAAGKSALCAALLGRKCLDRPQPVEVSTVGIAVVPWRAAVGVLNRFVCLCVHVDRTNLVSKMFVSKILVSKMLVSKMLVCKNPCFYNACF